MGNPDRVRSCVACKKRGEKGVLIKLANTPSGVVIDYAERLPGRGAYICDERPCIEGGLKEGILTRAFRTKARPPGVEDFYSELRMKVERKVGSLLGMARKSGLAAPGFEAALAAARKSAGGLLIMAEDVSENTRRKLEETVHGGFDTVRYSTKEALGKALGCSPVAVLFITRSSLAAALNREIGRFTRIGRGVS